VNIRWTAKAGEDLSRLYGFLAKHDADAADEVLDSLIEAPERLVSFPRRGWRLTEFEPRQVHEYHIGNYRMRYELVGEEIRVVRVFHAREDRF
jgi:plasmid stabilization system protein ParE